jgi:hypothetical protein
MRSLLATLLAFAAVLLVAAPARAQSVSRRTQMALWSSGDTGCFTLTVTRDPATFPGAERRAAKSSAKEPEVPASRWVAVRASEGQQRVVPVWGGPGPQSRAPTLCSDPQQPGCQCEQPEAPTSHGNLYAMADGVTLLPGLPPLGAPDGVDLVMSWHAAGGPHAAHTRPALRPPSA